MDVDISYSMEWYTKGSLVERKRGEGSEEGVRGEEERREGWVIMRNMHTYIQERRVGV